MKANIFSNEEKKDDKNFIISFLYIQGNLTFKISKYKTFYNIKYNLIKISYLIQVFDSSNNSIFPSDLTLYYNLRIVCFLNTNEINITSLAGIESDKYFKCTEFFNVNEKIQIGFMIYGTKKKKEKILVSIPLFSKRNMYNYKYDNDDFFNTSKNTYDNNYLLSHIDNNENQEGTKKLKKLYVLKPFYLLKRNYSKSNKWIFANLFNEYFCFCKGFKCRNIQISKKCKYFFYIYLIDQNRNIYKKNHFLLMDFILKKYTSADVYPIFEKMINRNISAHYFTEREDIYEKYCHNNKFCDLIIRAEEKNYKVNDEFLEKHFTLILKLKQVLSSEGVNINFINNLFYNIDYVTYICIGHGVSYFKYYLYKDYYGPEKFDKLLIPNSKKLIQVPIKYGWKDENIIKFNLPRWEKFNYINEPINKIEKIKSNSIFIMFTWREIRKRRKISEYYIRNIIDLLNNKKMINNLKRHKLFLYFSLHHKVLEYKKKFIFGNFIKYIDENDISECLSKTKLLVTDYSSIIFDMIYRGNPYIIFIPDANDSKIKKNYKNFCYKIIKNFKNNDFGIENIFFDINSAVNKINYYIDNDFKLDIELEKFYKEFNFKKGYFVNDFINYLLKL